MKRYALLVESLDAGPNFGTGRNVKTVVGDVHKNETSIEVWQQTAQLIVTEVYGV
jgi:hypothetical protein